MPVRIVASKQDVPFVCDVPTQLFSAFQNILVPRGSEHARRNRCIFALFFKCIVHWVSDLNVLVSNVTVGKPLQSQKTHTSQSSSPFERRRAVI
jgi:hypothetical protein